MGRRSGAGLHPTIVADPGPRQDEPMCLIAFAWNTHPRLRLLLLANRDEFHARPTAALRWWSDAPQILAGRDLQEGGTWLGISRSGRVAAVTNVRAAEVGGYRRSRGHLVSDFLSGTVDAARHAQALEREAAAYGGFNLLLFDGNQAVHASNRPGYAAMPVGPGVHALSNAALDTPWPKVRIANAHLRSWLARHDPHDDDPEALFAAMADRNIAGDGDLPDTGVGQQMERLLSSAFICTPTYGTRSTSLLTLDADGRAQLRERRFDTRGAISGESEEHFRVAAS